MTALACPCECNRGGFCGGCGHVGCSGGINVPRRKLLGKCSGCDVVNPVYCPVQDDRPGCVIRRAQR